ncbi:uncharacterized protein LODBEIA_P27500 [Lodderomyces beijingensis]|uniref:Defect at low temperature protein 1 n=1 Tax=Lodderomyces beijingensis TaxID=1775926 RepID=A0ABP0ZN23_9ASCO
MALNPIYGSSNQSVGIDPSANEMVMRMRTTTTTTTSTRSRSSPLDREMTRYTTVVSKSSRTKTGILRIPHRVVKWLYSISMVIVIILMLAFIAVTPIDVIVQTFNSSNSTAVKTFLVIIVCVAFLVISIIIYTVRVYKFKVAMNDIPAKSSYIPFENDYPDDVFRYIDSKLKHSYDVAQLAGPLMQHDFINHPGLSPPEYIQKKHENDSDDGDVQGRLLPPNMLYEDVLQSFADKFYIGKLLIDEDLPINFSIKDIFLYLSQHCAQLAKDMGVATTTTTTASNNNDNANNSNGDYNVAATNTIAVSREGPDIQKLISIYEKCRFSGKLIKEKDLFQMMLEFDKFGRMCQNDYRLQMPKNRRVSKYSQSSHNYDLMEGGYLSSGDLKYYSSAFMYDSDDGSGDEMRQVYAHGNFSASTTTESSSQQLTSGDHTESPSRPVQANLNSFSHRHPKDSDYINIDDDRGSSLKLTRHGSLSSSRSVIRNKLAMSSKHTLSNIQHHGGGGGINNDDDDDDDTHSLVGNRSGYVTDSENDEMFEKERIKRERQRPRDEYIQLGGGTEQSYSGLDQLEGNSAYNRENSGRDIRIVVTHDDLLGENDELEEDADPGEFYRFRRQVNSAPEPGYNGGEPVTPNKSPER